MCQTASKLFLKCELQDVFIVIAVKDYAICISVDDNLTHLCMIPKKTSAVAHGYRVLLYFETDLLFYFLIMSLSQRHV